MIEFPGATRSPSAERNKTAIATAMLPELPRGAKVLEIASGTGQHGFHMTKQRPDITWQLSDQDPQYLSGLTDLHKQSVNNTFLAPIRIDVTQAKWWQGLGTYDAVYCANMIHIAPRAALPGLAQGIAPILKPGGVFILYGPFLNGTQSAPSNLDFDKSLKSRNLEWGVYDLEYIKYIFADQGLACTQMLNMPRDNFLFVFRQKNKHG